MFIRYNETAKFWEYDTSVGQTGAGPWLILPIDGHYQSGNWTPTLSGATTPATGQAYTVQTGHYTKIGRTVICDYTINISNVGSGASGNLIVAGLPFPNNVSSAAGSIGDFSGLVSGALVYGLYSYLPINYPGIAFGYKNALSTGMDGFLSYSFIQAGSRFIGSIYYFTA